MRRLLAVVLSACAFVVVSAATAGAHAVLESSEPADGATLNASPTVITVTVSEEPDAKFSSISVLDGTGRALQQGSVRAKGRALSVATATLERGVYVVSWRVLSRVDGHVTGGSFAFGVGVSPSTVAVQPPPGATAPGPSALSIIGRVTFYAGLMVLLGAGWLGAVALTRPLARLRWAAWTLAVAGAIAIGEGQRRSAEIALGDVWSSSIGRSFAWRVLPLAVGGLVLMFVRGKLGGWLAAGAAAGSMLAHVAYGHAGASSTAALAIGQQWAHFLGGGTWLGGLVALLVSLRGMEPSERGRVVRAYSRVALWAVVVIAGSGTARALTEVGSFSSLTSTSFGRLVLAKVFLLISLIVLGAVNRFRHVPRAEGSVDGLRRVARAEIAIAAVVLASTGVLSGIAPARTASASSRLASVRVEGADLATTARARLEVAPGGPGPNAFTLRLSDYDSAAALDARVRLTFRSRLRTDVEASRLELTRSTDGAYRASGANLAFGGPWSVEVLAQGGTWSTTIPLTVFPRIEQRVTEAPSLVAPTLYTVALEGDRSVQFYVDPGMDGQNEVHATFLRTSAQRTIDVEGAVLVATLKDGEPVPLALRELTPGHLVASTRLQAGRWRFDVAAAQGTVGLTAFFEQDIGS